MTDTIPALAPLRYRLTLFVTGATARSLRAVENVRRFCEQELSGLYELEVIDLYRFPERAKVDQVVAAPTLLRHWPNPARYAIGDMSNTASLRAAIKVAA